MEAASLTLPWWSTALPGSTKLTTDALMLVLSAATLIQTPGPAQVASLAMT